MPITEAQLDDLQQASDDLATYNSDGRALLLEIAKINPDWEDPAAGQDDVASVRFRQPEPTA